MSRGPEKQFDRQEVVEKAMRLFWTQGYEATGMTQLVQEMGIGRQSLYDTFGDKRSLFLEALEVYMQRQLGAALRQLRAPGSPLANIGRVFEHWMQVCREAEGAGCLMGNSLAEMASDPELARVLEGHIGRLEKALTEALRKGQKCGEVAAHLPARELARALMSLGQGVALLSKLRPDPGGARKVMKVTLSMLQAR